MARSRKWSIQRGWIIGAVLLMTMVIAACDSGESDSEATSVPTVDPASGESATPAPPTTTPIDIATLPPTWTPRPEGFVQEVQPTATRAVEQRTLDPSVTPPTSLPPTWTTVPTQARSGGGSSNPGFATRTPFPPTFTPPPVEDICFLFTPESELNLPGESVNQGDPVTIYWNPIPGDGYTYEVKLYHPDGNVVVTEVVDATEYEFSEFQLATAGYAYGWEVSPLLNGESVCFAITGEIYVNPVFE